MVNRYYVQVPISSVMHNVVDRHDPDNVVAYCLDEFKAFLVCGLLNDSWNNLANRSKD